MAVLEKKPTAQLVTRPTAQLAPARLKIMLRQMLEIRRAEEKAAQLYKEGGKISGFLHLIIGQEAVCVGINEAIRPTDHIMTTYRDHGLAMLRGVSVSGMIGELMGRECGCAKGRGGSMHMFNVEQRFHGGHAIIGAHLPLAAGFAFASKYRGENDITVCMFGDGTVPNGGFHEAANLAGLWHLPLMLVIENNVWAMGTHMKYTNAQQEMWKHAESYNIKGVVIEDGQDVQAVQQKIAEVAEEVRQGHPALVEIRTYRFQGHSMSDGGHYRTKEELEAAKKSRDPITKLKAQLIEAGHLTETEYDKMDMEIREMVQAETEIALASPEPDPSTVGDYVYSQPVTAGQG